MKKLCIFITLLIAIIIATCCLAKEPIRTIEGTVTKITNGDTILVTDTHGTKIKVLLYGIDAPEIPKGNKKTGLTRNSGQPYGTNALQALEAMVLNKPVRLDVMAIDNYKRTVAIVWIVDKFVNEEMVRYGWAWAYRQYLDSPYASVYIGLEEQARKERRGLWQQGTPQPPWEYRKLLQKAKKGR